MIYVLPVEVGTTPSSTVGFSCGGAGSLLFAGGAVVLAAVGVLAWRWDLDNGMFPCFFGGVHSRFEAKTLSARMSRRRDSEGSMTSSSHLVSERRRRGRRISLCTVQDQVLSNVLFLRFVSGGNFLRWMMFTAPSAS